jgi:hypothetical protein
MGDKHDAIPDCNKCVLLIEPNNVIDVNDDMRRVLMRSKCGAEAEINSFC